MRDGEAIWSGAVGLADLEAGTEATPGTQYRVGSITKTFTAAAIMQLRDAGKLDLDDRLGEHLPGIAHGAPTLRRMLAHISGLQREAGEMFVTGEAPTIEQVLDVDGRSTSSSFRPPGPTTTRTSRSRSSARSSRVRAGCRTRRTSTRCCSRRSG